ncbi:hypothetical protein Tco_0213840 [Tanacetum coccineum]
MIPLRQKNTLAKYMILSGADNRPPMLDKDFEIGLLIWPIIEENGVTRTKKYAKLSAAEKIQVDYDMTAYNILSSRSTAVISIPLFESPHRVAKELWRESITDASLPPKWSKFVTDVKLVKDLHTTNFDQLHAYLEQHELHENEVRILRRRAIKFHLHFVANQQMDTILT